MSETSKWSIFLAPLSPLSRRAQVGSTPQPSGVSIPNPVTTTRLIAGSERNYLRCCVAHNSKAQCGEAIEQRRGACSAFSVLFEKFDCVTDGQDSLGSIIGDFAAEFLFEGHHELDGVEAVGAKIVDETCLIGHLVGLYAQVLHDDLFHPLANVTHRSNLVLFRLGCDPKSNHNHRGMASSCLTVMRRSPIAEYRGRLPRLAAPAGPKFGYHTSIPLTSAWTQSEQAPKT